MHGVRQAYTWPAEYVQKARTSYSIIYWNRTPGAAVTVAGERRLLDRQHMLLIPPETWFERENLHPFEHWWCHLRVDSRVASSGAQTIAVHGELERMLEDLWASCWDTSPATPASLVTAYSVVAMMLTKLSWTSTYQAWSDPRLAELGRWLEEEDFPAMSNHQLAEHVNMHPKAFSRLFQQVVGTAPQDWLRSRRLELAAKRLCEGYTIDQAAAAGGFADRFHFSRLFVGYHGIGPGYYRRLQLGLGEMPDSVAEKKTRRS